MRNAYITIDTPIDPELDLELALLKHAPAQAVAVKVYGRELDRFGGFATANCKIEIDFERSN